jgi:hypothetical protein
MKKLIILISLFFVSTFCHAQEWEKVYSINFIKLVRGEWVDEKSHQAENTFIMLNGSEVIIKATEINRYMTYGDMETNKYSSHTAYSWKCLDKEGDECLFVMKSFTDRTKIYMIVYKYFGVEFYIK